MGALLSYLKWRGDGSFSEHPYNEVDGLALSMLSYTRFTNIIPPPFIDAEAIKKAKGDLPEPENAVEQPNDRAQSTGSEDKAGEPEADRKDDVRFDEPEDDARSDGPEDDARSDGPEDDARSDGPEDDARSDGPKDGITDETQEEETEVIVVNSSSPEWYEEFIPVDVNFLDPSDLDEEETDEIIAETYAAANVPDHSAIITGLLPADLTVDEIKVTAMNPAESADPADDTEADKPEEDIPEDVQIESDENAVDAATPEDPPAEADTEPDTSAELTTEVKTEPKTADSADEAETEPAAPEDPPVPLTPLPLCEAAEKCLTENTGFDTPFTDECREFLREIGKSKRFGDLILSDYVSVQDDDESLLFSALCIDLPDGTRFISYRGTGVEIEDWRQDFMISFQETPAQKMALNYLLNELLTTDMPYRLGGHSKGANLALYAAMMLPEEYRDRIVEIYSADGPGICPEFRHEEGYNAALSVMKRVIPEFSVIGRLFEPPVPAKIVASSESGILQHDALTWQIEGSSFVTKSRTAVESDEYYQIFNEWIESADMEDREAFTEDFFDALRAGGASTVDDIAKSGLGGFGTILYSLIRVESQTKIVLGRLFRELLLNVRKLHPNDIISTKTGIAGLALLGLGFVFLALPDSSYHIVGYASTTIAIAWCIWNIYKVSGAEMRPSERQARVLLLLIPLLLIVFIACHPKFIPFIENIIVGILFLWLAERFFRRSLLITETTPGKIILIVISALFTLLGIFSVAAPSRIYSGKSLTIGGFLVLMGVALLFSEIHRIVRSSQEEESE